MGPFARQARLALLMVGAALAGCADVENVPDAAIGNVEDESTPLFRYNREYVFVAAGVDPPVIAPFSLRAIDDGNVLERTSYGWLARGPTWDRFLEETGTTSRVGGVWRVLPQGELRVIAGGTAEVEALRFLRAERRLRLDIDEPLTEWNQGGETRFRLLPGRLSIGAETLRGPVLELLRVERMTQDGWPPPEELDALFVTSGDSLQFLMAESTSEAEPTYAWLRTEEGEQSWPGGQITGIETRPLEDARRDVPVRWSIRQDEMGVIGEVAASGFDALLGPERGGRRAVEIRYTVMGWIEAGGERIPVAGMLRHTQQ